MSGKSDKTTPIVSILTPSFNHEKYVGFFIDSLLAQTNPNWELIIVDDCSRDNNIAEIKKYSDPRIKLIQHDYNKGINAAINTAFEASKGQYLSLCASDDALDKNYVEDVINTMSIKEDIGVIYYSLQAIDSDSKTINNKFLTSICTNKYDALKHCFYKYNCFVSPGMSIRRKVFQKIYPLNLALSQHQDYKMHIDLSMCSEIYVSEKHLVKYRIPTRKSGISFVNSRTIKQWQLEENLVMDSFLQINDIKTLDKIFGEDVKLYGKITKDIIPYVLGMLALNSSNEYKKIWGYNQISKFLSSKQNYDKVNKLFGFCYKDFLNLVNNFDESMFRKKYKKYKKVSKILGIINVILLFLLVYFYLNM